MKIVLDLKHSLNNYHWENKEELEKYIYDMLDIIWKYYQEYIQENFDPSDEIYNRLYNILDMFTRFEIEK